MQKITKKAFTSLLENIANNKKISNEYQLMCEKVVPLHSCYDGIGLVSALTIRDLSDNHRIDDHPDKWGITENEGHIIRHYFQENMLLGGEKAALSLIELYNTFSHFQGENKDILQDMSIPKSTIDEHNNKPLVKYGNKSKLLSPIAKKIGGTYIPLFDHSFPEIFLKKRYNF